MKAKCLIVDDELTAREGLKMLCDENPQLNVVGICKNGMEAIDEIHALKPDLVLLDVQMPGVNGFEVVANIPEPKPKIIFITAHDQFAIRAFEINAIDYLLKPFSDERFEQAIHKAIELIKLNKSQNLERLIKSTESNALEGSANQDSNDSERLVIKSDGSVHIIQKAEIKFIEAFDYYVKIHVGNRFYLIRETMKKMERLLDDRFMRIHKSSIVNRSHIKSINKHSSTECEVVLTTSEKLKVSRSKIAELKGWLG
ncbi:MAG: response regulator transcription factor [Cyclobacteriaceae bacterium]